MHFVVIFDFHIPHIGLCLPVTATCSAGLLRSGLLSLFAYLHFLSLDPSFLSCSLLISISLLTSLIHALLLVVHKDGFGSCILFASYFW